MSEGLEQVDLFQDGDFLINLLDSFKANSKRLVDFLYCHLFALVVFLLHKYIQTSKSLHYPEQIGFEVMLRVSF